MNPLTKLPTFEEIKRFLGIGVYNYGYQFDSHVQAYQAQQEDTMFYDFEIQNPMRFAAFIGGSILLIYLIRKK